MDRLRHFVIDFQYPNRICSTEIDFVVLQSRPSSTGIDSVVPELPLSVEMPYPPYFFLLGVSQLPESAVRLGVSSGAGAQCNDVS